MPISPTGSLRSFRGFAGGDQERVRSGGVAQRSSSRSGADKTDGTNGHTADDESVSKSSPRTIGDLPFSSPSQAPSRPSQDLPSRLTFSLTAAPGEVGESPRSATVSNGNVDVSATNTLSVNAATASSSSQLQYQQYHLPPSPLSAGSPGGLSSHAHSATTHTGSSTPPSAIKSPGSGGGFFSILRPTSPRVDGDLVSREKRKQKERTVTTADKGGEASRDSGKDKNSDIRSRRNGSMLLDHVGSVFERFGKKVHYRSDSKEASRGSDIGCSLSGSMTDEQLVVPLDSLLRTNQSELLEELAAYPPPLLRNPSSSSSIQSIPSVEDTPAVSRQILARMLIQVTEDNERFLVVDVSGLGSAAAIKERMLSKLHRFEDDPSSFIFYRTEIGMVEVTGPPIAEDSLLTVCRALGDDKGSLKFLLKQIGPPARPTSTGPPPTAATVTSLSRQQRNRSHQETSASPTSPQVNLSPSQSGPGVRRSHAKADSLSSLSSAGDVTHSHDGTEAYGGHVAYDSSSETGRRLGLARSKGVSRRSFASGSGTSADDPRLSLLSHGNSSRPSSGLLSVREQRSGSVTAATRTADDDLDGDSALDTRDDDRDEVKRRGSDPIHAPGQAPGRHAEEFEELHHHTEADEQPNVPRRYSRPALQRPATSQGHSISQGSVAAGHPRSPSMSPQQRQAETEQIVEVSEASRSSLAQSMPKQMMNHSQDGSDEGRYHTHDAARMYNQPQAGYDDMLARKLAGGSSKSTTKNNAPMLPTRSMDDLKRRPGCELAMTARGATLGASSHSTSSRSHRQSISQFLPEEMKSPVKDSRYPSLAVSRDAASTALSPASANGNMHRPGSAGPGAQRPSLPLTTVKPWTASEALLVGAPHSASGAAPASASSRGHVSPTTSMRLGNSFDGGTHRDQQQIQPLYRGPPPPRTPQTVPAVPREFHMRPQPQVQTMPPHHHMASAMYANEFGARAQPDPRMASRVNPSAVPFLQRPHTIHDAGNPALGYHRPVPLLAYRESQEDPYIQARFPASSARQVSQFQRTGQTGGIASLTPGMTVQETLQHRRQSGGQEQRSQLSPHPHFGPREPRAIGQSQPSPQWDPRSAQQIHQQQQIHQMKQQDLREAASPHPPALLPRSSWEAHRTTSGGMHSQQAQRPSHEYHHPRAPATPSPQNQATRYVGLQSAPVHADQHRGTTAAQQPPQQLRHGACPSQPVGQQPSSSAHLRGGRHADGSQTARGAQSSDRSSDSSARSNEGDAAKHHREHSRESSQPRSSVEESTTAPTSARSSGSGQSSHHPTTSSPESARSPNHPASSRSKSQAVSGHGTHDEIDVTKIRPLPRLPKTSITTPAPATSSTQGAKTSLSDEDEGTLKAERWAALLANVTGDGDTLKAPQSGSTFSLTSTAATESSSAASSSTVTLKGAQENQTAAGKYHLDDEGGGTFASFADDEDDEEGGTWAKPLDAAPATSVKPLTSDQGESNSLQPQGGAIVRLDGSKTLKLPPESQEGTVVSQRGASPSRRPELRLTIDAPNSSATVLAKACTDARDSPALSSGSNGATAASLSFNISPGILRKSSFARRDNAWAMRPPPEQLYENLDAFFPRHDLDKPVLDAAIGGSPPSPLPVSGTKETSRTTATGRGQQSTSPTSASSLTRHKKSIRRVAEDRMRFMEMNGGASAVESPPAPRRAPLLGGGLGTLTPMTAVHPSSSTTTAASQVQQGLARRRSTKLWGTKLLEMTPGSEQVTRGSQSSASGPGTADSSATETLPVFKWVKGDLIGKGTYGRVYLALNATTGEMIAVKQVELPRTESDREDTRQKGVVTALKSEIDTLKDLDHPNIVSYLGFEETPKYLHLFLEYVPGGSIASVLRKYGPMEEGTIKFFVFQILSGLTYLHERGVLHRDLKGDNLLVTLNGTVKISDFGTVRKSDNIYSNVEGMSLQGSVFWMAPEVVTMNKKGYSAKVDIWSLGCVVLEMLAGRRPWSDDEAVQAMFKIGKEGRAPPIPPDVRPSPEAAHFLKKCFELDPNSRPTAARLLEHVFPYNKDEWSFTDTMLYKTMKNTVQNR